MAKHTPSTGGLTRDSIAKRIQDEMRGIKDGDAVDFGTAKGKHETAPAPSITELGLPSSIRKKIETLVADHAELGKIEREAKKDRDTLTAQIKDLLAEHVPEDVTCFQAGPVRVARYTQNRPSFDKEVMKAALLRLGVQPKITNTAMAEATTIKPVVTLRISTEGEDA